MQTLRLLITISFISATFSACDLHGPKTVVGSGPVETEEIPVSGFTGISVTGKCNVDITIGDEFHVEYHAQQQVLNVMTAEVRSAILNIGFNPDYNVNTNEEIAASIVLPAINFVGLSGAGGFVLNGEKQAKLDIQISGTGDVYAFDMEVDECTIGISGVGNCEVNVLEKLQVMVSGVGNIFYKGSPDISSDISGVGNIVVAGS